MSELIEQIRSRAHNYKKATDCGTFAESFIAKPPASEEEIKATEQALGFELPPLLRELYLNVGNGGFGPGYGLYGVPSESNRDKINIVNRYFGMLNRGSSKPWPERVITVCTWGCGIDSVVDCSDEPMLVIRMDPNMGKDDVADSVPNATIYGRAGEMDLACWIEWASFDQWIEAWVAGRKLFYLAYGDNGDDYEDDDDIDE